MSLKPIDCVGIKVFALFILLSLAGCSTVSEMKETKGEGDARAVGNSFEEDWEAANYAVNAIPLPLVSSDKDETSGTIIASTPASGLSWGENIAVFVDSVSENKTVVEVISKPALATNIFAPDWTVPIFNNMNRKLVKLHFKPTLFLVQATYDRLPQEVKDALQDRYEIRPYDAQLVGRIIERQVQNVSSAGSTTGSDVGSSLASAVYVNNAISSGGYNMWTDIAVGVLGGVAGSGANKAPRERYLIQYTIRNLDGQIKSTTVSKTSPIGLPIGECFDLKTGQAIDEIHCTGMTSSDIKKMYLQPRKTETKK